MLKIYRLIGKPLYTVFVYVKMAVEDQSGIYTLDLANGS